MQHITIEQINSLTTDEKDLLLCIVNLWAKIEPPMPTETDPYPISLNIVRYTMKEAVIDRILQAEKIIKDEAKEIYNGLRIKLGLTPIDLPATKEKVEEKVVQEEGKKDESNT